MKKLLVVLVTNLLIGSAFACQTTTIIVNGKITTCTVCGNLVSCM